MALEIITVDLETFWSSDHTLKKMNPLEYVMHPETELISIALKQGDEDPVVVFGEDNIRTLVNGVNWSNVWVVGHNMSAFDSLALAWRLGVNPKLWGCTLAMARPLHAKTVGLSLGKLVTYYGIGTKDNTALVNTRGKHLKDFTQAELRAMAKYNKDDAWQCYELFKRLLPHYSAKELWHLDSKIRCLVEPQLQLDVPMLEEALEQERKNKREVLLNLAKMFPEQIPTDGMPVSEDYLIERVRAMMASAPMFSQLLDMRGVPIPYKPSPSNPDTLIPALAKTDEAFIALQEHEDEVVATAASARLSVKSTLAETRMQAFIQAAEFTGGKWPVTVHYCGADTTGRASGWLYNPLNLPRVNPKRPRITDALRMSITAPPGYKIVVADLSGIEMRFNHFLWQVPYSTQLWQQDPEADIYRASYAMKLGIRPEEVTGDQRQASKVENLALGFGMGPDKYVDTARIMGGLAITPEQSRVDVYDWRNRHPEIVQGWKTCHTALSWVYEGMERPIDPWGLYWTCAEGIKLPSGRMIRYPNLRKEPGEKGDEWWYGDGRHKSRIYAGKVTENCISEGTLVLTDKGWIPIERVTRFHKVHDGVEFVHHSGLMLKGVQGCLEIDGVFMTPDHEVLTNDGWQEASQFPRPYRLNLRLVNCTPPLAQRREERVPGREIDPATLVLKQVYDILNAGPRSRFVVLGTTGPFIVHNCVQAGARDVVYDVAYDVFKQTGYRPTLEVYDELVYVVPEDQAEQHLDLVHERMRQSPTWFPELVTWSKGDIGDRYGAVK